MHLYRQILDNCKTKADVIAAIKQIRLAYENAADHNIRRNTGIYYTGFDLAERIAKEVLRENPPKPIKNIKFFEPCVGIGNFVFAYLSEISNRDYPPEDIRQILSNIYACDIDKNALEIYKQVFVVFAKIFFGVEIDEKTFFSGKVFNSLSFNLRECKREYGDIRSLVGDMKFDVIITNPPYKNLKTEQSKYGDSGALDCDKECYAFISDYVRANFRYANEGVQNLYKIFVEDIICNYASDSAVIGLLIPSTILTDKTCSKLRRLIIENNRLCSVLYVKENNPHIMAQQALSAITIRKGEKTKSVPLYDALQDKPMSVITKEDIGIFGDNVIFSVSENEKDNLRLLGGVPKLKDVPFVINKRGELDLTADKKYISSEKSKYRLMRGRNISYYEIVGSAPEEYVSPEFLEKSSKRDFATMQRIAGQQVSNLNKSRRLSFAIVPDNCILANSCNFLYVSENKHQFDIFTLLGLMNSKFMDWLFRLTSSNNHVNNYEIDALPIVFSDKAANRRISGLAQKYINTKDAGALEDIEREIADLYGLNKKPAQKPEKSPASENKLLNALALAFSGFDFSQYLADIIYGNSKPSDLLISKNIKTDSFISYVLDNIADKYKRLHNVNILNHITSKLSDLDCEMIETIPQGGNWKNIRESVMKKSNRLLGIKRTGGRTTLYGRIHYGRPSYTITTFFNRPGNGTYVHPMHNRLISVREAARFQSFPDDFYFIGNKGDILKQVGNAVPPLLAYSIAKAIKNHIDCEVSADLFCGAGGLTAGFKKAGIKSALCSDIEKSFCATLKVNNPETDIVCGDITAREIKDEIIDKAKKAKVDMICGGPPCQGFSLAGKRFIDDPRNRLFRDYLEIIGAVKPKVVVLENVEGMLSMQGGEVYRQILRLFDDMGYKAEARLLTATDYGVPQKRKRLVFICIRNDINANPGECFPEKIIAREGELSAFNAIGDLENAECSDDAKLPDSPNHSLFVGAMRGEIPFDDYLNGISESKQKPLSLF